MSSILHTTLNTRALPTDDFRYTPESPEAVVRTYLGMLDNLMGFLTAYVKDHPETDINIIIPNEKNIKAILESI